MNNPKRRLKTNAAVVNKKFCWGMLKSCGICRDRELCNNLIQNVNNRRIASVTISTSHGNKISLQEFWNFFTPRMPKIVFTSMSKISRWVQNTKNKQKCITMQARNICKNWTYLILSWNLYKFYPILRIRMTFALDQSLYTTSYHPDHDFFLYKFFLLALLIEPHGWHRCL
jgi:hypothetical protein